MTPRATSPRQREGHSNCLLTVLPGRPGAWQGNNRSRDRSGFIVEDKPKCSEITNNENTSKGEGSVCLRVTPPANRTTFQVYYEIYSPRMLPIFVNALFRPLARVVIPAVAAKATSAMINRYSTSPWPVSSFCKWFREFRIRVFMLVFLLNYLSAYSQRRGWSRWVGTPNALWISKRRTKAALTGCRAALPPSKLLKTGCRFQFVREVSTRSL